MNSMVMRLHVMPGGIVIGHVVPKDHPVNGHIELKENHVYELNVDSTFDTQTFREVGSADFTLSTIGKENGCSVDQFIARSHGHHLVVNGQ